MAELAERARVSVLFAGAETWEHESGVTSLTLVNDDSHGPGPIGNLDTLLTKSGKRVVVSVKGLNMMVIDKDPN